MFAQALDVRNKMPRRIVFKRRVWSASSRAPLIEENHPIGRRVKELAVLWLKAGAWPSMKEHDWLTLGITALLIIEFMNRRNSQAACAEGFDGRI
jgi:hypothetical protein